MTPLKALFFVGALFFTHAYALGAAPLCESAFKDTSVRSEWKYQWGLAADNKKVSDFFSTVHEGEWVTFSMGGEPVVTQVSRSKEEDMFYMTTPLVKASSVSLKLEDLEKHESFEAAMKEGLSGIVRRNRAFYRNPGENAPAVSTVVVLTYVNSKGSKSFIAGTLAPKADKVIIRKKIHWDERLFAGVDSVGRDELEIPYSQILQIWSIEADILDSTLQGQISQHALSLRALDSFE